MIIGLGSDIIEIERLQKVVNAHGEHFLTRVFTERELLTWGGVANWSYLAGRWAGKEAAAKALGCGIGENCAWLDLEILRNENGAPKLYFKGSAATTAEKLGVQRVHITISHERSYAIASVILEGETLKL
ncbi:MAG: holo-ACP synthase [Lentisphaeria bacterium]|nr:holo-ACP synthase [Lentisphaeria bacterium]